MAFYGKLRYRKNNGIFGISGQNLNSNSNRIWFGASDVNLDVSNWVKCQQTYNPLLNCAHHIMISFNWC